MQFGKIILFPGKVEVKEIVNKVALKKRTSLAHSLRWLTQ